MLEIMKGIQSTIEALNAVKPKDRVLVIADNNGGPVWAGQLFINVLGEMGAQPVMVVFNPPEMASMEPPASVAAAMKNADVIFRIFDKKGPLVHTESRRQATAAGAKYYFVTLSMLEDMKNGLSTKEIQIIKDRTLTLTQMLTQAKSASIATPEGTNISMSLEGRKGISLHPWSALIADFSYYAESAIAPLEGTAEGNFVVDIGICEWGYLFRKPLRCTVKGGLIIDVSGGTEEVTKLRGILSKYKNANNIAELGIGTNHIEISRLSASRHDASRLGTAHLGIGRNDDFFGVTKSEIHMDLLMDQATVYLDDRCVLKNGKMFI